MPPTLAELVKHYDRPGPRYTGYPMPPAWREDFPEAELKEALNRVDSDSRPLSLYAHLPFCLRRCSYCACNMVASPTYQPVEDYLRALEAELDLWAKGLPNRREAVQLHWGGGTPTYLEVPELQRVFRSITDRFTLRENAEVSVEVDPTFLQPDRLPALRELGFNRVSFGVQDLDEHVQELIGRGQTWGQTLATTRQARSLGFQGVNLDLVYGLPGQTLDTFRRTLEGTLELAPDRLAIYGFAYLPKLLAHQRRLPVDSLPSAELRLELLILATEILEKHGYVAIGMDHFARPEDEMAKALREGRLIRNFMGYAVAAGSDLLGFGPSAISNVAGVYSQNEKNLARWERSVRAGQFATRKGHRLSSEDLMRRWVIHSLMGSFELRWTALKERYGVDGPAHFADALRELKDEEVLGTVEVREEGVFITPLGRRFVRNLVQPFDAYLRRLAPGTAFSRTV
jgi:oxygen-independent coproporphyrinogen III oxidase